MDEKKNILAKAMDVVNAQSPNRTLIFGAIIGLILGLIFAWKIWPVEYVNGYPKDLEENIRRDYLRMVIESYMLTSDEGLATTRLDWMEDTVQEHFDEISSDFSFDEFGKFRVRVETGEFPLDGDEVVGEEGEEIAPETEVETDQETGEESEEGPGLLGTLFRVVIGLVVLGVVGAAAYYFLVLRKKDGSSPVQAEQAFSSAASAPEEDLDLGEAPPLAQWMTTFTIGDDLFDDSFSIDAPTGEFLGECGVGIADTIGVGDPKKVSAFEIWLFDKNDIQTVTKVMMSQHGFVDSATKDRLAAKGEPLAAELGHEIVLETETLQMVARIVDLSYGEGALPENSYFDRMTIELAVWTRN